jgi:hypothetical protein
LSGPANTLSLIIDGTPKNGGQVTLDYQVLRRNACGEG